MWQPLKINGENYFFQCELLRDGTTINYYICDLKFIWSENISMDLFLTRVKDFNKRIEYTKETVLEAITSKIPDQISFKIDQTQQNEKGDFQILQLKYYILGRPLSIEWELKLCDQTEFEKIIINPLLLFMTCLTRKNDELLEIIKKKDIEIEQYKQEGAILRRSKIATEPFNNDKFEKKFPKILLSESVLKYANENFDNIKQSCKEFIQENDITEELLNINNSGNNSTLSLVSKKTSPVKSRRKKRFLHNQQQLLEQRLKAREQKIDYDDSDSPCTPPIITENPEVAEIKKRLSELKRQHEEDLQNSKEKSVKH